MTSCPCSRLARRKLSSRRAAITETTRFNSFSFALGPGEVSWVAATTFGATTLAAAVHLSWRGGARRVPVLTARLPTLVPTIDCNCSCNQ